MKNLFVFVLSLFSTSFIISQDVIVTIDNQFLEVKIISMEKETTFFKESDSDVTRTIANKFIKGYQWNSKTESKALEQNLVVRPQLAGRVMYARKSTTLSATSGFASFGLAAGGMYKFFTSLDFNLRSGGSEKSQGVKYSTLLGASLLCAIISIGAKKEVKYWKDDIPVIGLSDYNRSLLQKKYNLETSYLSAANSGVGLQLNF